MQCQLSQVNLHQHKLKWSKVTKSSHCPSPTHSKSYCAVPLPYCVFVGMFRPLEFSFFLFLKAGAPIKACMNRQQCGRTERQLAESRLAAVSWCCTLCTLFAGLSSNLSQEIGQDSHKNIYKNVHTHSHIQIQGICTI